MWGWQRRGSGRPGLARPRGPHGSGRNGPGRGGPFEPAASPAMGAADTLAAAEPGQTVTVQAIRGGGRFVQRLLDLGFLPGVAVTVLRRMGMGGPIEVRVQGCRFAMRWAEAGRVVVRMGREEEEGREQSE